MFRKDYQKDFVSIFYSCGSSPLDIWNTRVKNGYIRRVTDEDLKSLVLEISGTNVTTTYISCPAQKKEVLGIHLPFLTMLIKNLKKYFTFEITILDDANLRRRFRLSNFQSVTRVKTFSASLPLGLAEGWSQVQFNLADFTRKAYGTNYVEAVRVQINANCRLRRIYFTDRLRPIQDIPKEYRLAPPEHKKCVRAPEVVPEREEQDEESVSRMMKEDEGEEDLFASPKGSKASLSHGEFEEGFVPYESGKIGYGFEYHGESSASSTAPSKVPFDGERAFEIPEEVPPAPPESVESGEEAFEMDKQEGEEGEEPIS